jgi:hypothetical protein
MLSKVPLGLVNAAFTKAFLASPDRACQGAA